VSLISKLTGAQAREVVRRLASKDGAMSEAVKTVAKEVLSAIDIEETADEVFYTLDDIDVHDCWDRAGRSYDGYTSSGEAAVELVEETLQEFYDQADRYHKLGMIMQEHLYCMGVVLGIYLYEYDSQSEFKDWCIDVPIECAGFLLETWRKRTTDTALLSAMDDFIRLRCPKWHKYLVKS
jgi:hypothetical protein